MSKLTEFVPDTIWILDYPVRYFAIDLTARMSVIRLADGRLILHSPGPIDADLRDEIRVLGDPAAIVAPGSFHYLHVPSAQQAFPEARTFLCPGIEIKRPDLQFDGFLSDTPPDDWKDEIGLCLVRGNRVMWEVAFLHRASRTLLLVDLIENIGDATPDTDWKLKFWWKLVFRMWNRARPAPEYQMGWKDKQAACASLERILDWDFERIILSHGENILCDADKVAREAWAKPLNWAR